MLSIKKTTNRIDKFFFEEKPTEGIAIFRIVWVSILILYFLVDLGNIHDFYGPHAIISQTTSRNQFPMLHANIFNLFNSSYEVTYGIIIVYGISLLASLLGLFTRKSLIVAFVCMTSLHQRNIWLLSSSELLMRTITLYLIFSPCGHSLSLDSILGKYVPSLYKKRNWSVWALRLIQIQISVIYIWTIIHKLKGDSWLDGSAVYYATRLEGLTNFSIPFLLDSVVFLKAATWGTMLIELSLGTLIWFNKFRKPVIIVGILFHLGIEYVMSIPFFELYMMALLIHFFTPEEHKTYVDKVVYSFKQAFQQIQRGQHETAN